MNSNVLKECKELKNLKHYNELIVIMIILLLPLNKMWIHWTIFWLIMKILN